MELITVGIGAILVLVLFIYLSRPDPRMPPGPFKWPIVGNLFGILPRDYLTYMRWRKYGDVMTVHLGPSPIVVLNSYNSINEAFLGQADIFGGRIKTDYFDLITHDSGIIFHDGPKWQEHRRFTLRMLRDFGLGRSVGETIVRDECEALCDRLESMVNQDVNTRDIFTSAINNVIARLIFGERCGSEDPDFQIFTKHLDDILNFRVVDLLPLMFPWIIRIPPLLRFVEYFSQIRAKNEEMHTYIARKITARVKLLRCDENDAPADLSEASDLCEAYVIEQHRQEKEKPGAHTFTDWQVIRNMFELFLAGTETTSTTLTWTTLLLAMNPEIQRKAQQEIADKVGTERTPVMSDLKELPYIHALMDEVLRYSSLVPTNVGHRTLRDTELMGHFIPYNTMITSNLYLVHHDPELWEKPDEFYPEHFLDDDGQYQPSKYLIPFSLGKRACLGESLARMEYFIAVASMMQRFDVRLKSSDLNRLDEILSCKSGGVRQPLTHNIIFTKIDRDS